MIHQLFHFSPNEPFGLVFVRHDSVNLSEYEEVWIHTSWTVDNNGVSKKEAKLRRKRHIDGEKWGECAAWADHFGHTYGMEMN